MNPLRRRGRFVLTFAMGLALSGAAVAQVVSYATPNTITGTGPLSVTFGDTVFTNWGPQGVGRIDASLIDAFGDTFGSVSGLQIGNWTKAGAAYSARSTRCPIAVTTMPARDSSPTTQAGSRRSTSASRHTPTRPRSGERPSRRSSPPRIRSC